MRLTIYGTLLSITVTTAAAAYDGERLTNTSFIDPHDYANKELGSSDWSAAEAALMGLDVPEEDKVFAKLNLAFVYSSTGRRDLAVALYNEILEDSKNPYALTASGEPRRVKSIARLALSKLESN